MTTECRTWRWYSPYPYMVIPSINRFSLPLLGSYYWILLAVDFDSQLGSCYWYIQGNDSCRWCDDKMTYMAREISPHCYIGWSLSVASHRHSTEPARQWKVRLLPLSITTRHRCRGYIYCQYGELVVLLWWIYLFVRESDYDTLRTRYLTVIFSI